MYASARNHNVTSFQGSQPDEHGYYYEAYQRGAADARAALLAEVCAWLRASRAESHREAGNAIEAKFGATDQPKEKP